MNPRSRGAIGARSPGTHHHHISQRWVPSVRRFSDRSTTAERLLCTEEPRSSLSRLCGAPIQESSQWPDAASVAVPRLRAVVFRQQGFFSLGLWMRGVCDFVRVYPLKPPRSLVPLRLTSLLFSFFSVAPSFQWSVSLQVKHHSFCLSPRLASLAAFTCFSSHLYVLCYEQVSLTCQSCEVDLRSFENSINNIAWAQ